MAWSRSVAPAIPSTRKSTALAIRIASSAWRRTTASRPSAAPGRNPPVSTSTNGRPAHSAWAALRSRVIPGRSWTTARRVPSTRLKNVDLPTFGRPMMATTGAGIGGVAGAPDGPFSVAGARVGLKGMERATGFEPATSSLGSSRSTN
jgi:hypothetical protein